MSEKYEFKLNKKQGDMVARALSVVSFSVLACFGLAIFWGLLKFISHYSSILLPPVVAIVLSMIKVSCLIFNELICKNNKKTKILSAPFHSWRSPLKRACSGSFCQEVRSQIPYCLLYCRTWRSPHTH